MVREGALALAGQPEIEAKLRADFGPVGRALARSFFEPVRFPQSAVEQLAGLHQQGFVVHVMRSTSWVNYLYLSWALVRRGLPPVRGVVNLRPWITRPFTLVKSRGPFAERFDFARRQGGSGLVFLRESVFTVAEGREPSEDPFPALVALARTQERPVFLVPELFVWEMSQARLAPSLMDRVWGSPEAPGFAHSVISFFRNYQRAQFRVGEPLDLSRFIQERSEQSDQALARTARSVLHHHLARETRAVFGPPRKTPERLIDEAMRDRVFQQAVREVAREKGKSEGQVERDARRLFGEIAARPSPTTVGLVSPLFDWIFNRIYDGVEVDEAGLERAMKAAARAPVVLTPSHKSHIDYLIMTHVLWQRGYAAPLVAAGANLGFFPLGVFLRRGGAFFLRRSFKGDKLYTAVFKAYLKKLVHDGIHHEFFPEGGRSRTGKLLQPKLGLFTWLTDAVLEGARDDLLFVPVAIDYERVVEGKSYTKELTGGDKKPEDLKALLAAPAVLAENYGRIHLTFDEPVSLKQLMEERGLGAGREASEEQKKALVRALGNRVMYGIARVSTVTPHALLAAALLAHRRRGISAADVASRVDLLLRLARSLKATLSTQLAQAPLSPAEPGPLHQAMGLFASEGFVRLAMARGETIYQVEDDRRAQLAFYKNTLLNLVAGRTIVCAALQAAGEDTRAPTVRERALFLSRLLKLEFIYPVGKSFESLFDETVAHLIELGLMDRQQGVIRPAPGPQAGPQVTFLGDLVRDLVESYRLAAEQARATPAAGLDRKEFLKKALEDGRAEYLAGTLLMAESLSKTTLENALQFLVEQGYLVEEGKLVKPGGKDVVALLQQIAAFLPSMR